MISCLLSNFKVEEILSTHIMHFTVTFNYRLGSLGFLNTGDETYPANLGMKDQVLALRWVRDNMYSKANFSLYFLVSYD